MRAVLFLLRKEFLQIFRHRIMLPMIFVLPIVQLLVLTFAADFEVRSIHLRVLDEDRSTFSRRLIDRFSANRQFVYDGLLNGRAQAFSSLEKGEADLFLVIPANFERDLRLDRPAKLQLTIDAINGVKAGIIGGYASAIIRDFDADIRRAPGAVTSSIEIRPRNWFNPELEYANFMVPGILVVLVTLVGMFLCGMNIVKEKEIGTIEQINVSPIRKHEFIMGKLLPFWIIGMAELAVGLSIGKLVFDIPLLGSLWLVFAFSALYLPVVLGLGLLVSTFTQTQQQAMFIAWFLLIIFILMSGLFTPIQSMPDWARQLTRFNPVAYFVELMRLVLLKGSGWADVRYHFAVMLAYGLAVNSLAIWNYRKQGV